MDENFFGLSSMVTKFRNTDSNTERLKSRHKEKMGPVMLKIKYGSLMEDWIASTCDTVEDYKTDKLAIGGAGGSEVCINETWITNPPNILFFALPRVNYDPKTAQLTKDLSRFTFDKVIYADQMLEANQGRLASVR